MRATKEETPETRSRSRNFKRTQREVNAVHYKSPMAKVTACHKQVDVRLGGTMWFTDNGDKVTCRKCLEVYLLSPRILSMKSACGACSAGILVMNGNEVQACDDCGLFDSDEDAAKAVEHLLKLLSHTYQRHDTSDTVADALARLRSRVVR
jgi:hypothetical protein